MTLTWLILQYALIGAASGILAGLLGLGGGVVIIPALAFIFTQQAHIPNDAIMHFAIGTSLASIIVTTLYSFRAQYRYGNFRFELFKQLIPGIFIGTIIGALLSSVIETRMLKILFGLFMIIISTQMFFSFGNSDTRQLKSGSRWMGSLFIGTSSGLLGVGGSAFMTPWLNYFNIPIRQAIAASTACGVIISLTGTTTYILTGLQNNDLLIPWSTGYIYWPAVIAIACSSLLFVNLGVLLSFKLPVITLRYVFAVFVFLVGLNMLFR